jgi:hypothetical protein
MFANLRWRSASCSTFNVTGAVGRAITQASSEKAGESKKGDEEIFTFDNLFAIPNIFDLINGTLSDRVGSVPKFLGRK